MGCLQQGYRLVSILHLNDKLCQELFSNIIEKLEDKMPDICPCCKQVLPWKSSTKSKVVPIKEESKSSTFRFIPPKYIGAAEDKQRQEDIERMRDNTKLCQCWLCGHRMSVRVYSDHMDKHRKEGWKPSSRKSSRPKAEVLAEFEVSQ